MKSHSTRHVRLPPHLTVVFTLSRLLQRMELSSEPVDPRQYLSVAQRLAGELAVVETDASLAAILHAHPSAAELYENLHYAHAGLCRAPLDAAAESEIEARELLARLGRHDRHDEPGRQPQ